MNGINAKENEICGDCKESLSKRLKKSRFDVIMYLARKLA